MPTVRTYHASCMTSAGRAVAQRTINAKDHAHAKAACRRWARSHAAADQWTLEGPSNTAADAWASGTIRR